MTTIRSCLRAGTIAGVATLLLAAGARAQGTPSGVYRCGNTYSSAPCPGGRVVAADDARSDAQRQQALAAKQQEAQLAENLAAERRAREHAASGQKPTRIGPSEAERARTEALATKKQERLDAKRKKRSSKPGKPGAA